MNPNRSANVPETIVAFLAVASKAAGFALFVKVIGLAFARIGDSVSTRAGKDADGYAFLFEQLGVTYKPLPPLKEKAK